MARLQPKLPRIEKKGRIDFVSNKTGERQTTPFARYEDIDAAIRPLLSDEGFSLSFDTEWGADGVTARGTLSHRAGHARTATIRLPLDSSGSKNSLQAMGSTVSYAKRYLVGMLLNIVTVGEDTDGNLPAPVTAEEAAELRAALERTQSDEARFCRMLGVETLEDLQQRDIGKARNAIKAKERQLKSKTGSGPDDRAEGRVLDDQGHGRKASPARGSNAGGRDGAAPAPSATCSNCAGRGVVEDADGKGPCPGCNGTGQA
jgi:hypothetical protein